jgi:pimeloyl-ACP methyl ester carboxylesterase
MGIYAASALMLRTLPRGDGHPVLVLPGFTASDTSTRALRRTLRSWGYFAHGWRLGRNLGPTDEVIDGLDERVASLAERHQQPISLVGWSLGGIYARELAKLHPEQTRCVVTLGTPFSGHPKSTNVWRIYELLARSKVGDPAVMAQIRTPPPVPTTSIYSRSDGIVSWRCSINEPGPLVENIEVPASHVGMGANPLVLYAVADRLAQPIGAWQPFELSGVRRLFFRTAHPDASAAPA